MESVFTIILPLSNELRLFEGWKSVLLSVLTLWKWSRFFSRLSPRRRYKELWKSQSKYTKVRCFTQFKNYAASPPSFWVTRRFVTPKNGAFRLSPRSISDCWSLCFSDRLPSCQVAQSVMTRLCSSKVVGSIPPWSTFFFHYKFIHYHRPVIYIAIFFHYKWVVQKHTMSTTSQYICYVIVLLLNHSISANSRRLTVTKCISVHRSSVVLECPLVAPFG